MKENKVTSYLLYAIGEIVLVIVGILVAIQIDNLNEDSKERKKEIHYLVNIKRDLENNLVNMDNFLTQRAACIVSAQNVVAHLEGKPITDWHAFNEDCIRIYDWRRFYQVNYTFEELTYSGNLAIISNDSIKSLLLNLESLYKQTKAEEDHFRFDSEEIIYKPIYEIMDLNPMLKNYMDESQPLSRELFGTFFTDTRIKNGFLMAILEFSKMNAQLEEMKATTRNRLAWIMLLQLKTSVLLSPRVN